METPEFDSVNFNKELNRIIRNVPLRVAKAKPVNDWQKSFLNAIEPCIQDLKRIPVSAAFDLQDSKELFTEIEECAESNIANNSRLKLEIVSHFSNRILKNVTNNYNSLFDKLAVSLLVSGKVLIEGRDALVIYGNLRELFFQNPEFKEAYNNGCLKQLDEIAESLVMVYFLKNRDIFN